MRRVASGTCRSEERVACSRPKHSPIATSLVAPDRPVSSSDTGLSAERGPPRLPVDSCPAPTLRLPPQPEQDPPHLPRIASAITQKTPKRRARAKLRDDRRPATRSNETRALDFVHDQLATGRRLRVLTVVDTFWRFSPALEPRFTFRGADVVRVPEGVGLQVGLPATIQVDQGTEFVSRALDLWAYQGA